jgi:type IX secretion system PorP/SprF family membrane protein
MRSQHYQFSQFYAAPTYLNPAFTGANVCSRGSINYRNQWSGIPGSFTSYQASVDHSLKRYNSGIGLVLFNDRAGIGSLTTTQVSLLYAYEARFNKKYMGRGGISIGTIQRKVDYSAFTFGDQLARNAETSLENFAGNGITYFDVGAGILIFSSSSWLGISGSHLNKPNQSLLNATSALPAEIKVHGGYKFTVEEHESSNKKIPYINAITFAFNFKNQQKFNQLDLGIYYNKNWFVIGAWYRGIPLTKPNKTDPNNDAVIFLLGVNISKYKIGYSYDMTISKLTNASSNGSHEISMSYQFCNFKKAKRKKNILISCPKF